MLLPRSENSLIRIPLSFAERAVDDFSSLRRSPANLLSSLDGSLHLASRCTSLDFSTHLQLDLRFAKLLPIQLLIQNRMSHQTVNQIADFPAPSPSSSPTLNLSINKKHTINTINNVTTVPPPRLLLLTRRKSPPPPLVPIQTNLFSCSSSPNPQ